jgi:hypothetical protein
LLKVVKLQLQTDVSRPSVGSVDRQAWPIRTQVPNGLPQYEGTQASTLA